MRASLVGLASFLLLGSVSQAAIVAGYSKSPWNPRVETHVIVASKGLTFSTVGYTQAATIREMYPEHQILFVTNLPVATSNYRQTKQKELRGLGFSIREENDERLSTTKLIQILKSSTANIRSMDIIGHNGVELGPWLEDGDHRMDYRNEKLMSQLKPLFNAKAYARLHGCNSGWNVAPKLSKFWGIPVLGSFTSTSFYFLATNGAYELVHGDIPSERVALNDSSQACPHGMCLTLTPESAPYHFHVHKSPEAAWLPYRKVICDASIPDAVCERAFAEAIVTSITPVSRKQALKDADVFKTMLEQSMCASYGSQAGQKTCLENLRQAHRDGNYKFLPYRRGVLLKCSGLRACNFQQDSIDLRRNAKSSTEDSVKLYFEHALRGHGLLKGAL
ncbi:MAG TPA: hypothetical protein VM432_01735 [Bdellovibrionales bacterium]|nr:hypothetical protein [Bdellovibrionales bacterium]